MNLHELVRKTSQSNQPYKRWGSLSVRTCELFVCFVTIVSVRAIVLTSLFSLFYVACDFHRFLHRGRTQKMLKSAIISLVIFLLSFSYFLAKVSWFKKQKKLQCIQRLREILSFLIDMHGHIDPGQLHITTQVMLIYLAMYFPLNTCSCHHSQSQTDQQLQKQVAYSYYSQSKALICSHITTLFIWIVLYHSFCLNCYGLLKSFFSGFGTVPTPPI